MLHFIGVVSFGAALPRAATMEQAGRRLGGPDFGPARSWRGQDCVFAWRALPLRAESATAPVPVLARDGALALIGCGRIDARAELAASLDLQPTDLSDTALMMAAFSRWGEAGVDRLMGNFGFAAWDAPARRLTLARDYLGTVPMFYHQGDGFAAFGTNPAALLALGLFSRDLDPATLAENIRGITTDPEAALYAALRRVRRGATVALDPSGCRSSIYWRPKRGPVLKLKDDQAYVEAARAVLAEVLRGHLRAQKPIGIMLSGGFDSGGVAATLALLAPEREIFGFTTVPVEGDPCHGRGAGREWEHVQRLARMYPNLKVEAVPRKTLSPLDDSLRAFFADTGLPFTGPALATRRVALAQAARARGVGTLLNGDGGNNTLTDIGFGVYRQAFQAGDWIGLAREIFGHARFLDRPVAEVAWHGALADIVPRGVLRLWHALKGAAPHRASDNSFLRPDFATRSGLAAKWERAPTNTGAMALLRKQDLQPLRLDLQPSHADAYTLAFNRMGLECKAPLRDRRMVDFVLSLPANQFQRDGVIRFLGRRVFADRLPAETLAERRVFESFPDQESWVAGWWGEAARKIADQHPAALAAEAIDLAAVQALLEGGVPDPFPQRDPDNYLVGSQLANALHLNQFIRWHQGMND